MGAALRMGIVSLMLHKRGTARGPSPHIRMQCCWGQRLRGLGQKEKWRQSCVSAMREGAHCRDRNNRVPAMPSLKVMLNFQYCTKEQCSPKFRWCLNKQQIVGEIPMQTRQLQHVLSCPSALLRVGSDFGGKREAADADSIETASRYTGNPDALLQVARAGHWLMFSLPFSTLHCLYSKFWEGYRKKNRIRLHTTKLWPFTMVHPVFQFQAGSSPCSVSRMAYVQNMILMATVPGQSRTKAGAYHMYACMVTYIDPIFFELAMQQNDGPQLPDLPFVDCSPSTRAE
eukprot:scaffold160428_cov19-Tisochrysis_lutea.AAC.1